jgi:phosphatidylserine/phosphatidylglycerophosphate/cardiolipin synthase-like enzyme
VLAFAAALALAMPAEAPAQGAYCFMGSPNGADCLGKLYTDLGRETGAIDVVLYRWWDRGFSDRLVAAHRAGKRVRVIADRSTYVSEEKTRREVDYVYARGIPVRITRHADVTHSKTTILHDRRQVVLATYHPVRGAGGWEMHLSATDDTVFRRFLERFERAWYNVDPTSGTFAPFYTGMPLRTEAEIDADRPYVCYENPVPSPKPLADSPTFDVCFTGDQNCQTEQLVPRIDRETTSLDIAAYSLSSTWMRDALIRFAKTGRPLRLLVDRANALTERAMRDALRRIKAAGRNVQIKSDTTDPARMHMKLLVGSTWSALGSANLRRASTMRVRGCGRLDYSDNNFMLVENKTLRNAARARFDTLWSSAYFVPFTP